MSRIQNTFERLKQGNEAALIPFIVCGDPDFGQSLSIARTLSESGADLLEIGIPFSDPVADGSAIQAADIRALASGMSCAKAIGFVSKVRQFFEGPIVVMTYCNPPMKYGFAKFCAQMRQAGADGIIVTDAPFEEALDTAGLERINLVAKNSGPQRTASAIESSHGFVYLVSFLGTTGSKAPDFGFVSRTVGAARSGSLPLCVGFGVSTPQDVRGMVETGCQGVIVGSGFCRIIEKGGKNMQDGLASYCRSLKDATKNKADG